MFYPIMLNIEGKKVSIVGGGKVAFRKVKTLLEYNPKIKVISPLFIDEFNTIKENINMISSYYSDKLIKDSYIVIAATSSKEVNEEVADFCKQNKIICNVIDDIKISDFIVPSTVKRGDLSISISTKGKSPSLCSKIRKDIEEVYTEDYEQYVELLGDIRELLLVKCEDAHKRRRILNEIIDLSLSDLIRRREEYESISRI